VEDDLAEMVKMLPKTMVDSGVCVTWWMCLEAYLRFVEIGKTGLSLILEVLVMSS
jgi:hypothetical protein